jgi:hypothetical protein
MLRQSDQDSLEWMRKQINAFKQNEIGLGALISNLKSLVNKLESLSTAERENFVEYWGDLEQIYAVVLDREMKELDEVGQRVVDDAIRNLVGWIESIEKKN